MIDSTQFVKLQFIKYFKFELTIQLLKQIRYLNREDYKIN